MSKKIIDKNFVSYCWLYCLACNLYKEGKCKGCKNLDKSPRWCVIRDCCIENNYTNCTECAKFSENGGCGKFDSMVMGCLKFFDNSERQKITRLVRKKGIRGYLNYMGDLNMEGNGADKASNDPKGS